MDIMDLASSLVQKVTKGYGKKIKREKTAPEIPAAFPVEIRGKTWRAGFARDRIRKTAAAAKSRRPFPACGFSF